MITGSTDPTVLVCIGLFGVVFSIVQAVKELERGRAERLIAEAKRDADLATRRCLEEVSARIRSDSDSFLNRFERWLDRSLRAPNRRSR